MSEPMVPAMALALCASSAGPARVFSDDLELLRHGMVVYDALYAWCREGQGEQHRWPPAPDG